MKSIKTFKQFNENYFNYFNSNQPHKNLYEYDVEDLGLSKSEELKIKTSTVDKIESMSHSEKSKISDELKNLTEKFGCEMEDLTNPVIVKEFLDREIKLRNKEKEFESVQESFGEYIKEKIIKFFSYVLQIGSTLGSLFFMISGIVENNFWSVFTGAMALAISILASAFLSSKLNN
jgi:hypothetical protein